MKSFVFNGLTIGLLRYYVITLLNRVSPYDTLWAVALANKRIANRIRPDGTFGKAKAAVDAAGYADAQAVYDEYTAPDTTVKPWFDFVKTVQQIAKDMTMPQLLNALMAKAAEHADPESDLKGKVRNNVVWGDAHEWEHALANAAHIAQQIQGRMNANVPPMAIAAE